MKEMLDSLKWEKKERIKGPVLGCHVNIGGPPK